MGIGLVMFSAGVLSVAVLVEGAFAHHSQAMFDGARRITLTGVVRAFEWSNPHVGLKLLVQNEAGELVEWTLEGSGTAQLRSRGWRSNSLAVGEMLTVVVHPLRSGEPGGTMTRVFRADGSVVGAPRTAGT